MIDEGTAVVGICPDDGLEFVGFTFLYNGNMCVNAVCESGEYFQIRLDRVENWRVASYHQ